MSFWIDDDKLLKKYKTIWIEIEDLGSCKILNTLPVYDDRYIKSKISYSG